MIVPQRFHEPGWWRKVLDHRRDRAGDMSNSVADFRRRASGAHLVRYLVEAGISLDNVVLAEAQAHWEANRITRKPICTGCGISFAEAEALRGGRLFATSPSLPGAASTSVFCAESWRLGACGQRRYAMNLRAESLGAHTSNAGGRMVVHLHC
jgi:hypothetical protein